MAYCQTKQMAAYAPVVRLTVSTAENEVLTRITWALHYIPDSGYAVEGSGEARPYKVVINNEEVALSTFDIDGVTKATLVNSGYVDIEKGAVSQEIMYGVAFDFGIDSWGSSETSIGILTAQSTVLVNPRTSYVVTYNENYDDYSTLGQFKKWHGINKQIASTVLTREGYVFLGWTDVKDGTTVKYNPGDMYTKNEAGTLYAVWSKSANCTITYDANGDGVTGVPSQTVVPYGNLVMISDLVPTRDGFTFKGWATSPDGQVEYTQSVGLSLREDLTLYAVWERNSYIVTYNENYGDYSTLGQFAKWHDIDKAISVNGPTARDGYTFVGWDTVKNGTTVRYLPGALYTDNASATLYAVWVPNSEAESDASGNYIDFKPPENVNEVGGLRIGKDAEATLDGVLDIDYRTRLTGGILCPTLAGNTSFNTLLTPNVYPLVAGANYAGTCPINTDGTLFVEPVGTSGDVRQVVTGNVSKPIRYERYYTKSSSTWSSWKVISADGESRTSTFPMDGNLIIPVGSGFMIVQWGRDSVAITNNTTTSSTVALPYAYPDNSSYQAFVHAYCTIPQQVSTTCYNLAAGSFKIYVHPTEVTATSLLVGWMTIGFSSTYPTLTTSLE